MHPFQTSDLCAHISNAHEIANDGIPNYATNPKAKHKYANHYADAISNDGRPNGPSKSISNDQSDISASNKIAYEYSYKSTDELADFTSIDSKSNLRPVNAKTVKFAVN
jgi:hypothetical protein